MGFSCVSLSPMAVNFLLSTYLHCLVFTDSSYALLSSLSNFSYIITTRPSRRLEIEMLTLPLQSQMPLYQEVASLLLLVSFFVFSDLSLRKCMWFLYVCVHIYLYVCIHVACVYCCPLLSDKYGALWGWKFQ